MAKELYFWKDMTKKADVLVIPTGINFFTINFWKKYKLIIKNDYCIVQNQDDNEEVDNEDDFRSDSDDEAIEAGSPPVATSATIPHNYHIYTNKELEKLCKTRGITGYSKQTKTRLIELLTKNDNK